MLLEDIAIIRNGLGFDDMPDINNAIKQGLNSAEPFLAARMNMATFERSTSSDIFWVDTPTQKQYPMVNTVFRLSSGLVTSIQSITRAPMPDAFETGDAVDLTGKLQINLAKGIVSDFFTDYDREYVRIQYTHGFELEMDWPEGTDPDNLPDPPPDLVPTGRYALSQVPQWLKEAASLQTLILLEHHSSFQEVGVKQDMKEMRRQLDILMANHIRYAPLSIMPL